MSEDMTKLFQMMKLELDKQTATITQSVTDSIMRNIDDKIKPILEENKYLKNEVQKLNDKARYLENKGKKNNLILHGIKEIENNRQELFNLIKDIMKGLNVDINSYEINNYYRLGKKHDEGKELTDTGNEIATRIEKPSNTYNENPNTAGHRGVTDHYPQDLENFDSNPNPIKNQTLNEANTKARKHRIYIATLNTRSLKSKEKLLELEQALNHINWDILGISDVRRSAEKIEEHDEYILYYKNEQPGIYGVGFLVKKYLKNNIIEFKGVSNRIAILNITLPGYKNPTSIVQIYAPTETAKKETKNEFYKSLNEIMENLYKTIIVMGDFNSQIDYNKAFDSLKHQKIWEALALQGVHNKYIRLLKNIYENMKARVRTEKLGEHFHIKKGVRQGDPLSPKLFSATLEHVFRQLEWDDYGININGVLLNHLRFADDLILISENPETLQKMIEQLVRESEKIGLSLNTSKTKLMTNYKKVPIKPYNTAKLEYVNEYTYLGQIISPKDLTAKEISNRINIGWKSGIYEAINNDQPEDWSKDVNKTKKDIMSDWDRDIRIDNIMNSSLILSVTDSDDEFSDNSDVPDSDITLDGLNNQPRGRSETKLENEELKAIA
uniref:Reverse transcriptase domain-containing protein n=1 Tax=Bombyx mori TaxID=7091 RepID=A0A8R2LZK0_BOMMO|nr:uncharacterized protein LOC119629240 [Bombyx mori]